MRLIPGEQIPKFNTKDSLFEKMKSQAYHQSQVMHIISMLSDVYGPRLMGTPNYFNSVQWIKKELRKWGIQDMSTPSLCDKKL